VASGAKIYLDYVLSGPLETSRAVLTAALEAAPIASVLFRPGDKQTYDAEVLRTLIAFAQKKGVATLILNDGALARKVGADGVHVDWAPDVVQQFKTARNVAGAEAIAGADAGRTRHDAMEIGEADADYVAFGLPAHDEDRERAAERQLDLVSWWSEVFEIPCVALDVADARQARSLADAGADFVGVTVTPEDTAATAAARVRAYSDAVSAHEDAK
jgi:thiamine-phosphate pyrophosphorylase